MNRYIRKQEIGQQTDCLKEKYGQELVKTKIVGHSVKGTDISMITIGHGKMKILMWSQMHGNESTITRALFDFLNSSQLIELLSNVKLYIIPFSNPDGAHAWIRSNANGIDLNRDCLEVSQPETKTLISLINDLQPDFCFNLHDQRTFYGSTEGTHQIPISFLAPAGDECRSITNSRLKAMTVINTIVEQIELPQGLIIGRYYDDFNPACIGDYCMSKDIPVILFEAGQLGQDYSRTNMIPFMSEALYVAVSCVIDSKNAALDNSAVKDYKKLPLVAKSFTDILLKNYPSSCNRRVDIAIMYHEFVLDSKLRFLPVLVGINNTEIKNGLRLINCSDLEFSSTDLIVHIDFSVESAQLNIKSF
jgi:hypothetical protein